MGRCLQAADIGLGKDDGMNILLIVLSYVSNTFNSSSFKTVPYWINILFIQQDSLVMLQERLE
jgi:hypothetical protein